jgi:hypothetical protein
VRKKKRDEERLLTKQNDCDVRVKMKKRDDAPRMPEGEATKKRRVKQPDDQRKRQRDDVRKMRHANEPMMKRDGWRTTTQRNVVLRRKRGDERRKKQENGQRKMTPDDVQRKKQENERNKTRYSDKRQQLILRFSAITQSAPDCTYQQRVLDILLM